MPGLTIANSGRAGGIPVVRIRSVNSTNSASPVYVVDGILQDNIDYLNPADIESIDVLRDPSSIAVYGMRAANGVIAVTLKKAARGKTAVSYTHLDVSKRQAFLTPGQQSGIAGGKIDVRHDANIEEVLA